MSEPQTEVVQTLTPFIEQYEFECLLSSRNAEQCNPVSVSRAKSSLHTSAAAETAPAASSVAASQDSATEGQTDLPALYSASRAVSKLSESSSSLHTLDRIRDIPVQVVCQKGLSLFADDEYPYSNKATAKAQRIGRPPSSKSAGMQARTWFDEVAAPRMQQMCAVQKEAVKSYDQALDQQVQQLTDALDMQSLQSVGTDVPARLVVDRVRLYTAEAMRGITANQGHVHEVQTQYTDALEDWVKSVFVRGIEDAIAARDAWHHDKLQHEQIMHNLRNSNMAEMRRALHNQSVDLARQHQTEADYAAKRQAITARDQALLELQELQQLHNELNIKSAAQTQSIEDMEPELTALKRLVAHLQGVEAKYEAAQQELEFSKRSLAETAEALQEWEAAEQQHKALFGPLANLDPEAMSSKLDATLAELKLIRVRQEQVLEQQEMIRLNAEKAQHHKEMQEQKARARQKALADKALQRYSGKPAFQPQQADARQQASQLERAPSLPAHAAVLVSGTTNTFAGRTALTSMPSMAADSGQNDDDGPTADAEVVSAVAPFFTNATSRVPGDRPAMRRGGIRGATPSPLSTAKVVRQQSVSNLGQTMTRAMAARSASPVFSAGKLQNALQRTLAQLPQTDQGT
ncbi:hypothetical protein ABBQ38_007375 [Trebouxia sp. C0009 RCD-2024]